MTAVLCAMVFVVSAPRAAPGIPIARNVEFGPALGGDYVIYGYSVRAEPPAVGSHRVMRAATGSPPAEVAAFPAYDGFYDYLYLAASDRIAMGVSVQVDDCGGDDGTDGHNECPGKTRFMSFKSDTVRSIHRGCAPRRFTGADELTAVDGSQIAWLYGKSDTCGATPKIRIHDIDNPQGNDLMIDVGRNAQIKSIALVGRFVAWISELPKLRGRLTVFNLSTRKPVYSYTFPSFTADLALQSDGKAAISFGRPPPPHGKRKACPKTGEAFWFSTRGAPHCIRPRLGGFARRMVKNRLLAVTGIGKRSKLATIKLNGKIDRLVATPIEIGVDGIDFDGRSAAWILSGCVVNAQQVSPSSLYSARLADLNGPVEMPGCP